LCYYHRGLPLLALIALGRAEATSAQGFNELPKTAKDAASSIVRCTCSNWNRQHLDTGGQCTRGGGSAASSRAAIDGNRRAAGRGRGAAAACGTAATSCCWGTAPCCADAAAPASRCGATAPCCGGKGTPRRQVDCCRRRCRRAAPCPERGADLKQALITSCSDAGVSSYSLLALSGASPDSAPSNLCFFVREHARCVLCMNSGMRRPTFRVMPQEQQLQVQAAQLEQHIKVRVPLRA